MSATTTSDAERFLELLKPIERELENYCRRLIWEPQEAPDALQNAVMRAVAALTVTTLTPVSGPGCSRS
jgi:DNA-directed RNA polymerase specialized sigma24 family protein